MKILFTGGGTGGHTFPLIAVIREIRRIYPKEDLQLFYIGPKDEWASFLIAKEEVEVRTIFAGKIRRYFTPISFLKNIVDIFFKIPLGILQAFFHIFFWAPDLIFSKGGYGSLPVVFSGWILQVPILLHESDKSPGLANRILGKFSREVFTSFAKTEYFSPEKVILVGNPIRRELLEGSIQEAEQMFEVKGGKPLILILGGSQGAQRINNVILEILPDLLVSFEIIHQTGENNFEQVKKEAKVMITKKLEQFYHPFPFLKENELTLAYKIADLIIGRAGAGTIFEIAALGKPSILIPLPEAAQDHQLKNAYVFARNGATLVIEEANFTPHFFLEKLKFLISHPKDLEQMQKRAKAFAKPQAAKIIAEYILRYLKA